ncbi:MAG TPA: translocase [Rhodanobacteraceae bacterium]|nr:translocase [Rhodanobacteraceae bacterium]
MTETDKHGTWIVRTGEWRALSFASLSFFCLLTAYYVIRPVRDQLAGATGSIALPLFYAGTFIAMLAIAPLFGWLTARLSRRALLSWSYGFFIVCLFAFIPLFARQGAIGARALGVAFFIWVSVFNLFVVSLFWSVMADVFDSVQARRLFPLICIGGAIGALAGPTLTSLLVLRIGVAPLLGVSAVLLCGALVLLWCASATRVARAGADQDGPIGGSILAGLRAVFTIPFVRDMALLMLLSDGVGTLAYALVADFAKAHYANAALRTAFYGHIDLAVNILQILLQVSLTRWMLVRLGYAAGLVVPAVVNVALLIAVFAFGAVQFGVLGYSLSVVTLMLIVTRSFAYGVTKPAYDGLYTRVSREIRYKGKNFVDTAVWRFGDLGVTSGLNLLRAAGVGFGSIVLLSAMAAGCAGWFGWRAARESRTVETAEEHLEQTM